MTKSEARKARKAGLLPPHKNATASKRTVKRAKQRKRSKVKEARHRRGPESSVSCSFKAIVFSSRRCRYVLFPTLRDCRPFKEAAECIADLFYHAIRVGAVTVSAGLGVLEDPRYPGSAHEIGVIGYDASGAIVSCATMERS